MVVGFDVDFSYPKLAKAICYLNGKDCHFIVTNTDCTLPGIKGSPIPFFPGKVSFAPCVKIIKFY